MGWDGSGSFDREHNWQQDADNDINIVPDRHDAEDDNLATGIEACLAKNGENTPTANLPMSSFKHTGVGDAEARTDYAKVSQVQDGAYSYAPDTGAADAYVMTLTPATTAYATGARYRTKIANTNTGASTLNINGVGATDIRRQGSAELNAGDLPAGSMADFVYDGEFFQLVSIFPNIALGASATVPDYGGTGQRVGWTPNLITAGSSRSLTASDLNHIINTDAVITLTVPLDLGADGNTVVILTDLDPITINTASVTLIWNRGGSLATGNRTVAKYSSVTLVRREAGQWIIFGNGIS